MFLLSSLTIIMSLSDKTKKAMEEVGLGSYEIKVYISLLENGSMPASEISKKSNVPYSKIYEVLNSLEERGWIESNRLETAEILSQFTPNCNRNY